MADTTWTRDSDFGALDEARPNRMKFVVGGLIMVAAIVYLIITAMQGNTQLYVTVDEFYADAGRLTGRDIRMGGLVIGESVAYTQIDATTSRLEFDMVDDLEDPNAPVMHVVAMNEPKPDLLQHQATALVTGEVGQDGSFYTVEGGLLLKCPTRYEEAEGEAAAEY